MAHRNRTALATMAALLVAAAPAVAQMQNDSSGTSGKVDSFVSVGGNVGNDRTDVNAGASGSTSTDASTDAISGKVSGDVDKDAKDSSVKTNDSSPSASPPMGDDKARPDDLDRQKMKQSEQIDKKNGLDRADAGSRHGSRQ
jgi:hypothetical protein